MNRSAGFSYVEVLVATVLIAVSLLPAMESLSGSIRGAGIHVETMEDHMVLKARLEAVLAEPYAALETAATLAAGSTVPSSYSDIYTYADGRQVTRNVYLSLYDGDDADGDTDHMTGGDAGLMWVRVAIPDTSYALETLSSE